MNVKMVKEGLLIPRSILNELGLSDFEILTRGREILIRPKTNVRRYLELWMLRLRLKKAGETVLNQLKKPTQRPILKWIFMKFRSINEVVVDMGRSIHRQVSHINDEQRKIIKLFGPSCEKYYI
jgi:hypothetical protein